MHHVYIHNFSTNPKKTLGRLRNDAIALSKGEYICQWDDDDTYSPLRLYEQWIAIYNSKKKGCILDQWLIYDQINKQMYLSNKRICEGSLIIRKKLLQENKYPELSIAEDYYIICGDSLHENPKEKG